MLMKRFTILTMLVALFSITAFAQKRTAEKLVPMQSKMLQVKPVERTAVTAIQKAPRRVGELVTLPEGAVAETYYTASGKFYAGSSSGWSDATADMKSVQVAVVGSDIYVQGLAYWFKDGWIKGTVEGTTATFASGQLIGSDSSGDEFIVGSTDGATVSENIVFNFDAEAGTLEAVTTFILESGSTDEIQAYCYWQSPVFTKEEPAAPEVVVLPEGVEMKEYALTYTNYQKEDASGVAAVGIDGNDVYFKGFSSYIPDALIKGTKEGNTITFPDNQYLGKYGGSYDSYLVKGGVFTYDEETDTYSAEGDVYSLLNSQYIDVYATNPVLKGVVEKAATPADPAITALTEGQYGWYINFNVPNVDTEGNGMVASKLSYIIYTDTEGEIAPLTFTSATHTKLTEDMTEIPFGFTEGYDFYDTQIYLNDLYSSRWNNIGIQSIYRGGGEENATEIQWFHVKDYGNVTFDFNAMSDEPCSSSSSTDGDITEDRELTAGSVTLTISPKAEGATTENRFWSTTNGPQLRVYSGTLTFEVPMNKVITQLVFNNGKWNEGNSADTGAFDGNTWTGSARKVVVTIAGNTQLNSIDVTTEDFVPTAVVAPEGLETEVYLFAANAIEAGKEDAGAQPYSTQVNVGFDGDDAYIQGLAADDAELWVKATKNEEGKYVIPANQFMGSYDVGGLGWFIYDYYFTAVDDEDNFADVVLTYDEAEAKFTTDQTVVLNGALAELDPYLTFTDVTITKINEVEATPADPSVINFNGEGNYPSVQFDIPTVGTNGEELLSTKLFYTIWIEKDGTEQQLTLAAADYDVLDEDITEIPYTLGDDRDIYAGGYRVYLNQDAEEIATWTKIGVQSIYRGLGVEHKSNIGWYEIPASGIATVNADVNDGKAVIYNLNGQRVNNAQKGIYIVNGRKVAIK